MGIASLCYRPHWALNEYIVEPAAISRRNAYITGYISFKCQILLSGGDGSPEALHFRFDDRPSMLATYISR